MKNDGLTFTEEQLTAALFRVTCPTADELREFVFGFLPQGEMAEVRTHVARCPHCAREYAEAASLVEGPQEQPTASGIFEQIRVFAARLSTELSSPDTSITALRGNEDGPLIFQAMDGDTSLEISLQVESSEGMTNVLGMLVDVAAEGWSVDLWYQDQFAESTVIDDLDSFEFTNIPSDEILLILRSHDGIIPLPVISTA